MDNTIRPMSDIPSMSQLNSIHNHSHSIPDELETSIDLSNTVTAYSPYSATSESRPYTETETGTGQNQHVKKMITNNGATLSSSTISSVNKSQDFNNSTGGLEKDKIATSLLSVLPPALKNIKTNRNKQLMVAKNRKRRKIKTSFMAVFVGILTAIGGFLYGYDTGVINGLLDLQYVKEHISQNGIDFDSRERAILTAVISLGTIVGSMIAPFISDTYGRKFCLIWASITFCIIGIVLQIAHQSFGLFLSGRLINGIGIGAMSSVIPLFQAEIAPKWIRGSIISFYQWAITWGLLVSSAVGQGTRHLHDSRCFRIPVGLQFVWCTLLFICLVSLPESPRFYVMHDDLDGAIISLSRLRRLSIDDSDLIEELIEIKASHDYEASSGNSNYFDCFKNSPTRHHQLMRMITGILLQTFQQASGINFIVYYGVTFFVATGVAESYMMSFVTYAVNVIFTIPGILLVDKLGRRRLLIYGSIGMIISNYVIAIVGLYTNSVIANKVMIAFVCTFIACFASTWAPVVWVLTGELYSLSIRQKAVSLSASTNWIVNFVFAYSTPYLIDEGNHTVITLGTKIFFLWGSLNVIGLIITFFFVYETKGLMLEEVDQLYRTCPNAFKSSKYNAKIQAESKLNEINREKQDSRRIDEVTPSDEVTTGDDREDTGSIDNENHGSASIGGETDSNTNPLEYLNIWEQKHQHDNILSDNIISRQSDVPFGNADVDDLTVNSEDAPDFQFNYGLYGHDSNHPFQVEGDSVNNDIEMGLYGENDANGSDNTREDSYLRNLRDVIDCVNRQSGVNIHLQGTDNENNNNNGDDTVHPTENSNQNHNG